MITYNHIELAHSRISKDIHFTPIFTSESINNDTKANHFLNVKIFKKQAHLKLEVQQMRYFN